MIVLGAWHLLWPRRRLRHRIALDAWARAAKFVLNFAEPAKEISPISLVKGSKGKALQNTNRQTIEQAQTLDDIW
jgi:hypothetical protein